MGHGSRFFSGLEISLDHTIPQIVAHAAARYGEKPFCIAEDGTVTSFAGFAARVASFGAELLDMGVRKGDRVAMLAPNSVEWIVAATAVMSIGAIMVPINTRFKGPEIRYVLEKARTCLVCTVGRFLGVDYPAMIIAAAGGPGEGRPAADLPHLLKIVELDAPGFALADVSDSARAAFAAAAAAVEPDTTADILFTSGTTGSPKGAMHSHAQGLWMAGLWNESNELTDADRMAVVNPFFHSFGYRSGWMSALTAGMTIYPLATFDAGAMLEMIERERISQLSGAPTIFYSLLQHPDFEKRDISSLRSGHTGGAKTPPDIIRAGYERLGFDIFLTSFGQTEATAMIATNRAGDPIEAIVSTVGRPIPMEEWRIVDEQGKDMPQGESGELLIRGPNVMQGYFEDPEQTAATIDADGWLHTGDVAAMDEEGRLRILDRIKDIVIVGGFNAYPVEIEIMLGQHPAIAEAAVIGLPDERMGEVTAACIVPKPGQALTLAELTEWARERMANYKVPRHLFVLDEMPRTPLGKIQKFELRKMAESRRT
ncbi:AMP-binding protein [Sphingobium sp. JS3065]|uniref:AMP-binding protein n=1 Tax=Sphingobium sp. JS3065 TaxID=2970925 RepID=UPI002264C903|nr:AMP-binding protein [Sphingobium sp. JS3065]UZW57392.1 AMP-binding protein [Sphingobium sp. JS3065]